MRREINMYNPASPGACWVMECQECFGAVLITGTLDYPLVNRLVTAKITQPPEWLCMCVCDYFFHSWNCAFICPYLHEPVRCICAFLCEFSTNRTPIHQSSVSLAFTTVTEPIADPACEVRALPANSLHSPPSPPWSPTTICMLMLPEPQNLAQGCICLHAD